MKKQKAKFKGNTYLWIVQCSIMLFISSCYNNKVDRLSKEDLITLTDFKQNAFMFNSIIDSVHYLMLETSIDCLIGSIEKMRIVNDTIFIGDFNNSKSIFAFSINGSFLFKIANHGKGKGEFIYLNDFEIVDNKVVLYDEKLRKILTYNKKGEFLYEKRLKGFLGVAFAHIGASKLAFFKGNITSKLDAQHELLICDLDGNIIDRHFRCKDWVKSLGLNANQFSVCGEQTFFFPSHGNTIYRFVDSKPQPILNINFGHRALNEHVVLNGAKDQFGFLIQDKYARLSNFISTEDFAFLSFSYNKYFYFSLIQYPNTVLQMGEGFANTTETDFLSYMPSYSYKNKFVSIVESFSVSQMIQRLPSKNDISTTRIYKQLGEELYNLGNSSNPVLVFYSLKKQSD